jgi:hypothetical protein
MLDIFWDAAMSIDRLGQQVAAVIHSSEPQIYGILLATVLVGYLTFPRKNDSDQI